MKKTKAYHEQKSTARHQRKQAKRAQRRKQIDRKRDPFALWLGHPRTVIAPRSWELALVRRETVGTIPPRTVRMDAYYAKQKAKEALLRAEVSALRTRIHQLKSDSLDESEKAA